MDNNIIKLSTHDGSNKYLSKVGDNIYKLCNTAFVRVSNVDNNINFIDPDGGPMITKGCKLAGTDFIVDNIEARKGEGFYITLK